jgi:hypothetical protein
MYNTRDAVVNAIVLSLLVLAAAALLIPVRVKT